MSQFLKYFLARIGLSCLLLLTLGFFVLYFVHEITFPDVKFDNSGIQWFLVLISIFFGFVVYGMIGDQLFLNTFHSLKNAGPLDDTEETVRKFEDLTRFTVSSFFLPSQSLRLRDMVVRKYADFLLSVGREDLPALKVYLKAFLQNPKKSRFRAPLLSVLSHGGGLSSEEIDLLLVMLKAEDFQDELIVQHLASVFVEKKLFAPNTVSLFLRVVESGGEDAKRIAEFVFPILLEHDRKDDFALRFYLSALPFKLTGEDRARVLLARAYFEGHWEWIDPVLHEKCGQVCFGLQPARQAEIKRELEESRISGRLKKIKLFTREDLRELAYLKVRLGLVQSVFGRMIDGIIWLVGWVKGWVQAGALKAVDGLALFGRLPLRTKLISLFGFFGVVLTGLSMTEWYVQKDSVTITRVSSDPASNQESLNQRVDHDRIHTIQVAAVTSQKQADRLVRNLQRNGIEGAYIIKTTRLAGGSWFKIRVGQFAERGVAQKFANGLINKKFIKNYFVITLPGKWEVSQKPDQGGRQPQTY